MPQSPESFPGGAEGAKKPYEKPTIETINEAPGVLDVLAEDEASSRESRRMMDEAREKGISHGKRVEASPEDYAHALESLRALKKEIDETPALARFFQRVRGIISIITAPDPAQVEMMTDRPNPERDYMHRRRWAENEEQEAFQNFYTEAERKLNWLRERAEQRDSKKRGG